MLWSVNTGIISSRTDWFYYFSQLRPKLRPLLELCDDYVWSPYEVQWPKVIHSASCVILWDSKRQFQPWGDFAALSCWTPDQNMPFPHQGWIHVSNNLWPQDFLESVTVGNTMNIKTPSCTSHKSPSPRTQHHSVPPSTDQLRSSNTSYNGRY